MNPLKPEENVKRAPSNIVDARVLLGAVGDRPSLSLEVMSATYAQGPMGQLQLVLQRPLYMGARLEDVLAARYPESHLFEVFLAIRAWNESTYGLRLTCDRASLQGSLHLAPELILDIATVQISKLTPWDVPADIWSRETCVE